ncbi:hypothetical protein D1631_00295 [Chryseobacterium nematophagum]|uniref:Uncharacterized protein n=1 Tax=Chryseobacterium nematophagum TaxID=2305228 RepID=A0A3M7TLL5_9FLAO|nr:hypothetical protein [Chryseobacterium nematophagum]RNA63956.1 hypothetical protein D1631_00145 [Chryseobacterium nematophagum]RNA63983.1 hypothetical protein D1631_00295 [Chryseobacterium nematophagum]
MDSIEELEKKILEIVREKHRRTGGNNGNSFGDFDHILNLSIQDRNSFLERMAQEKKLHIRAGQNFRLIMLPI